MQQGRTKQASSLETLAKPTQSQQTALMLLRQIRLRFAQHYSSKSSWTNTMLLATLSIAAMSDMTHQHWQSHYDEALCEVSLAQQIYGCSDKWLAAFQMHDFLTQCQIQLLACHPANCARKSTTTCKQRPSSKALLPPVNSTLYRDRIRLDHFLLAAYNSYMFQPDCCPLSPVSTLLVGLLTTALFF